MKANFTQRKMRALAKTLNVDYSEIKEEAKDIFSVGNQEYLVLTDEEADEKAKENIEDSLWASNACFVIDHMKETPDNWELTEKAIQELQSKLCESANPIIKSMIENLEKFVSDAISVDGRGHFLASYDGYEIEESGYYIYRIN